MKAYRMHKTSGGSDRYGNCEVCNKPTETTHHLVEMRRYNGSKGESLTHKDCHDWFGHKSCLSTVTERA